MFKKLMSVCVLSLIAIPSFADSIEDDRTAAVARAVKAEEEAKDVLRAAHIRALKSKIAANEMAVRRLKTKLSTTKDADAKVVIEGRIAELTDEVTTLTEATKAKVEVTLGETPAALAAVAQPAAGEAVPAKAGAFAPLTGIWLVDKQNAKENPGIVIICDDGSIQSSAFATLHPTADRNAFIKHWNGVEGGERFTRVSATKLRYTIAGTDYVYTMTRLTSVVPTRETFGAGSVVRPRPDAIGLGADHMDALRKFVKENPLK